MTTQSPHMNSNINDAKDPSQASARLKAQTKGLKRAQQPIPPIAEGQFLFLSTVDTQDREDDEQDLWEKKRLHGRRGSGWRVSHPR